MPKVSINEAVDALAAARCDRETRCGHVGDDRDYKGRDECVTVQRGKFTDEMSPKDCAGGVKMYGLDECLNALRAESCTDPFARLAVKNQCRSSRICFR